ncbi:MAG: ATP-binding protein [Lachnospiraceae bacterium]|nr:ATP-binding protein [Lachnospiraceae bacterium]
MSDLLEFKYDVDGEDFTRVGHASTDLKKKLKRIGIAPDVVRRVSIALYEGEINMVIHAYGGQITVTVSEDNIKMVLKDRGPGIPDVEKAMTAGFSTASENVRNLGFGAGMGLPNMKKYTDSIEVETELGVGTTVTMVVNM